ETFFETNGLVTGYPALYTVLLSNPTLLITKSPRINRPIADEIVLSKPDTTKRRGIKPHLFVKPLQVNPTTNCRLIIGLIYDLDPFFASITIDVLRPSIVFRRYESQRAGPRPRLSRCHGCF